MLGQVYSGYIPADEKQQLIAQAALKQPGKGLYAAFIRGVEAGEIGGFNVIAEGSDLSFEDFRNMGFSINWEECLFESAAEDRAYGELLEEWTRVIISRRLAGDQELVGAGA